MTSDRRDALPNDTDPSDPVPAKGAAESEAASVPLPPGPRPVANPYYHPDYLREQVIFAKALLRHPSRHTPVARASSSGAVNAVYRGGAAVSPPASSGALPEASGDAQTIDVSPDPVVEDQRELVRVIHSVTKIEAELIAGSIATAPKPAVETVRLPAHRSAPPPRSTMESAPPPRSNIETVKLRVPWAWRAPSRNQIAIAVATALVITLVILSVVRIVTWPASEVRPAPSVTRAETTAPPVSVPRPAPTKAIDTEGRDAPRLVSPLVPPPPPSPPPTVQRRAPPREPRPAPALTAKPPKPPEAPEPTPASRPAPTSDAPAPSSEPPRRTIPYLTKEY